MGAQSYPRTGILVSKLCFAINPSKYSVPVDLDFLASYNSKDFGWVLKR